MTKFFHKCALAFALIPAFTSVGFPQGFPQPFPQGKPPATPLKVQVVISRYDGDKKLSSAPYTLALSSNDRGVSIRMGSQIPVPNKEGSYTIMNVGTNIDCSVSSTEDGRFKVEITVDDSLVDSKPGNIMPVVVPTLKTFRTSNTVVLKDGQTTQFTAATDKVTGEVVKVDVTLNVEK